MERVINTNLGSYALLLVQVIEKRGFALNLLMFFVLFPGLFYSDVSSHTEPCYPCTVCPESKNIGIPCMENFDTTCICMNGYYEISDGKCLLCKMCDKGFGVVQQCSYGRDTLCEECPANTYSDQKSNIDPCLPCTVCEDYEEMISDCTPTQDAECICKSFWLVPFSAVHCECQIGRMCFAARSLSLIACEHKSFGTQLTGFEDQLQCGTGQRIAE